MKITTIKLSKSTKERLDNLRVFKRETYDDILQEALNILNLCRISPERARGKLIVLERERRRHMKPKAQASERSATPQSNQQSYPETRKL